MDFVPGCDHREDAIGSLARIYAVSNEKIAAVLESFEVLEIAQVYSQIDSEGFHFVVSHLLKSYPRSDIMHAYYYHSTSYDGRPSWFDDGLLGSSRGAGRFLEKITDWFPLEKQAVAKEAVERIVKLRSEYEGATAETCGPYAWDTLTAASSSSNGVSYRVPEAIQDLWSSSFCGNGGLVDLRAVVEDKLRPVVVKFKGKISNIDDYCTTLWAYLLSDDGECHLRHTFKGDGKTIPREDIVALLEYS